MENEITDAELEAIEARRDSVVFYDGYVMTDDDDAPTLIRTDIPRLITALRAARKRIAELEGNK